MDARDSAKVVDQVRFLAGTFTLLIFLIGIPIERRGQNQGLTAAAVLAFRPSPLEACSRFDVENDRD